MSKYPKTGNNAEKALTFLLNVACEGLFKNIRKNKIPKNKIINTKK